MIESKFLESIADESEDDLIDQAIAVICKLYGVSPAAARLHVLETLGDD